MLLFAALVLLPVAGQAEQALLWRVETPQGQVSHLFGTIHSEDKRVLDLPAEVESAYEAAETVVLEMVLTPQVQMTMSQAIMLPPSQRLGALLPDDLYKRSLAAMVERGYPEAVTERLQPWAIILTLSMPPARTGEFLDKVLHDRAMASGKELAGLETVDEQLSIFRDLSQEEQVELLRQTLQESQELPQMMEAMTQAWLQRDTDEIVALNEKSMGELPAPLAERFTDSLVDKRNHRMAERSIPYVEKGKAFIAVGALHLVGGQGVVALLREKGLKVTPVY